MTRLKEFRLFHVLIFVTFLVGGVFTNLVQALLFLLLPRRLFHRANYYTVAGIYGYLVCIADWWGDSKFTIYCSDEFHAKLQSRSFRERALVLCNHHTELDFLFCWQLADRCGSVGSCRALAKKVLQYVPVIGWSSYFSGDVFLSRSWEKDQVLVKDKVEALELQPLPTWLFMFPEGTRFTAKKHKASQEFASSRALPHLEHHLVPRTKGFSLVSEHLGGELLDLTFVQGEQGAAPTLGSMLGGHSVHTRVFIREFPLSSVPRGEQESSTWLMNFWKEKDDLKAAVLREDWEQLARLGSFIPRHQVTARLWPLLWTMVANMAVLGPLLYCVIQGGPLTWMLALLGVGGAWGAMHLMVGVSKIKEV